MINEAVLIDTLIDVFDRQLRANEVLFAMTMTLAEKVGVLLADAGRDSDVADLRDRLTMSADVLRSP